jgi:hypothetical protein
MFMDSVRTSPPVLQTDASFDAQPMRLDAGHVLKRLHFLEDAIVRACAAWIASVHAIETKALLAKIAWQSSLTADALRERVFEIRYPSRLMEVGHDDSLTALFRSAVSAPDAVAFLRALEDVFLPALLTAHSTYLIESDALADGPSQRFLELSVEEKGRAIDSIRRIQEEELAATPAPGPTQESGWSAALRASFAAFEGGARLVAPQTLSGPAPPADARPRGVPVEPARDARYAACRFYWPDTLDPTYDYGTGLRLQLRSAISHLNEVWAVEVAGAALYELSDILGWDFTRDAARWTYDESRHMLMGQRRIRAWKLTPDLVPLGRYIYDASASGGGPLYRIGMLGFFETKNIGKKKSRAREFGAMGDALSQRDMQFDWADETIHAEYGRRWLKQLLEMQGRDPADYPSVLEECEALVQQQIDSRLPGELESVCARADRLVEEAERLAVAG